MTEATNDGGLARERGVELPAATAWPMVLSLGLVLIAAGLATSIVFLVVGGLIFVAGLGGWIANLLPGRGHVHEPRVAPSLRAAEIASRPGSVRTLRPGMVGYRFNLPEKVHPISSGVKGGIVGGLLMPIPAVLYGILVHGSPWLSVNLLVGMVIPGVTDSSLESLRQFHLSGLVIGLVIHAVFSVTFGLLYGVILPTLPPIRGGPVIFGGVLMPFLWSGLCYGLMGIVDPLLERHVSWPWFIASQLVYGLAMSIVVYRSEKVPVPPAGAGPAALLGCFVLFFLGGCQAPGQPDPANRFVAPDKVTDFAKLYAYHCAGCHGKEGLLGPAPPLNDPVFLSIVPADELVRVIRAGRPGTPMPAFSRDKGGTLTEEQVAALAEGIRRQWGSKRSTTDASPPPYVARGQGDTTRGETVFASACASCHGDDGRAEGLNIRAPAFLALMSDQVLRRYVITGRPDLGMPSYADGEGRHADFRPLSDTDVDDLTALLRSWKENK